MKLVPIKISQQAQNNPDVICSEQINFVRISDGYFNAPDLSFIPNYEKCTVVPSNYKMENGNSIIMFCEENNSLTIEVRDENGNLVDGISSQSTFLICVEEENDTNGGTN